MSEYTPEEWTALGADPNAVWDPSKTAPTAPPAAENDPGAQAAVDAMKQEEQQHWGTGSPSGGTQFAGLDFNQAKHDAAQPSLESQASPEQSSEPSQSVSIPGGDASQSVSLPEFGGDENRWNSGTLSYGAMQGRKRRGIS